MVKRCPPGVLCIENTAIIFILSTLILVGLYFYYNKQSRTIVKQSPIIIQKEVVDRGNFFPRFNSGYSNQPGNVFMNPYSAPLKNNGFFPTTGDPRGVPINIKTQGYDTNYRQVGILTRKNGAETILPLMGRPVLANRNKWQYYSMSDKHNSVKLPVSRNGRSGTQEYGVDEVFNGDTVYVEGYNDAFKVTVYDNYKPEYIPFI
jgi:hypothetical protein